MITSPPQIGSLEVLTPKQTEGGVEANSKAKKSGSKASENLEKQAARRTMAHRYMHLDRALRRRLEVAKTTMTGIQMSKKEGDDLMEYLRELLSPIKKGEVDPEVVARNRVLAKLRGIQREVHMKLNEISTPVSAGGIWGAQVCQERQRQVKEGGAKKTSESTPKKGAMKQRKGRAQPEAGPAGHGGDRPDKDSPPGRSVSFSQKEEPMAQTGDKGDIAAEDETAELEASKQEDAPMVELSEVELFTADAFDMEVIDCAREVLLEDLRKLAYRFAEDVNLAIGEGSWGVSFDDDIFVTMVNPREFLLRTLREAAKSMLRRGILVVGRQRERELKNVINDLNRVKVGFKNERSSQQLAWESKTLLLRKVLPQSNNIALHAAMEKIIALRKKLRESQANAAMFKAPVLQSIHKRAMDGGTFDDESFELEQDSQESAGNTRSGRRTVGGGSLAAALDTDLTDRQLEAKWQRWTKQADESEELLATEAKETAALQEEQRKWARMLDLHEEIEERKVEVLSWSGVKSGWCPQNGRSSALLHARTRTLVHATTPHNAHTHTHARIMCICRQMDVHYM